MHFKEIVNLYKNHFGDIQTKTSNPERNMPARIAYSKDFIITGPGTFMLRKKLNIPDNIEEIVEKSKNILSNLKSITDTKYLINELKKQPVDLGSLNEYSLKNILREYPGFVGYRKFEIGIKELASTYERKPLNDLIYGVLLRSPKPMHVKNIWKEISKKRGFPKYTITQRLYDDPVFIKLGRATYTVKENIPLYSEKSHIIINFAKEWTHLKGNAISAFFICEVLKETEEIKDLSLGLVEHILATNPEFIKLPNGFYELANKGNMLGSSFG
jgi:hypothetical protein